MPSSKSGEKAVRSAERKQLRNRPIRSAIKTHIAKVKRFILKHELESAQKAVVAAIKALDKAAQKGVIHRNTAARYKSRLMRRINQVLLSGKTELKQADIDSA